MSISITDYIKSIQSYSNAAMTANTQQNTASILETSPQTDTYESTVSASADTALPCDTYNDIMELIKASKQAAGEEASAPTDTDLAQLFESLTATGTSATETSAAESSSGTSAGGSGGGAGGNSSSENETTTETIIGPDGSVYVKTTTTSESGEVSITTEKVSGGSSNTLEL